jgi:hypothetical protein
MELVQVTSNRFQILNALINNLIIIELLLIVWY